MESPLTSPVHTVSSWQALPASFRRRVQSVVQRGPRLRCLLQSLIRSTSATSSLTSTHRRLPTTTTLAAAAVVLALTDRHLNQLGTSGDDSSSSSSRGQVRWSFVSQLNFVLFVRLGYAFTSQICNIAVEAFTRPIIWQVDRDPQFSLFFAEYIFCQLLASYFVLCNDIL